MTISRSQPFDARVEINESQRADKMLRESRECRGETAGQPPMVFEYVVEIDTSNDCHLRAFGPAWFPRCSRETIGIATVNSADT